jgi:hypothetical protein
VIKFNCVSYCLGVARGNGTYVTRISFSFSKETRPSKTERFHNNVETPSAKERGREGEGERVGERAGLPDFT